MLLYDISHYNRSCYITCYMYMCVYIYIYIYIWREREGDSYHASTLASGIGVSPCYYEPFADAQKMGMYNSIVC